MFASLLPVSNHLSFAALKTLRKQFNNQPIKFNQSANLSITTVAVVLAVVAAIVAYEGSTVAFRALVATIIVEGGALCALSELMKSGLTTSSISPRTTLLSLQPAKASSGHLRIFLVNDSTGTVYTRNGRADSWENLSVTTVSSSAIRSARPEELSQSTRLTETTITNNKGPKFLLAPYRDNINCHCVLSFYELSILSYLFNLRKFHIIGSASRRRRPVAFSTRVKIFSILGAVWLIAIISERRYCRSNNPESNTSNPALTIVEPVKPLSPKQKIQRVLRALPNEDVYNKLSGYSAFILISWLPKKEKVLIIKRMTV
jgi:hypothetical protein